jgi:putative transposase
MRTEEQRRSYRREGEGYPNDLREAEWARLEPLIPKGSPGGGARPTCGRRRTPFSICCAPAAPGAICPDSFPPRSTVYDIFREFQRDGVWEAIWAELHVKLPEQMGWEASPFAAVLGSLAQQTTRLNCTMATVCKSDGEGAFPERPATARLRR